MRAERISCYFLLSFVYATLASENTVRTVDLDDNAIVNSNDSGIVLSNEPSNSVSVHARSSDAVQPLEDINSHVNVRVLKYHLALSAGFDLITDKELPFLHKGHEDIPFNENYFYSLAVIEFKHMTGGNTITLRANKPSLIIIQENTTVVQIKRVGDYPLDPNILKIKKQQFNGENIYEITMTKNLVKDEMYAVHLCFYGYMKMENSSEFSIVDESTDPPIPKINMFTTNFHLPEGMSRILPCGQPGFPTEFSLKIFRHKDYVAIANTLLERSTQLEGSEYFQDQFMPIYALIPTEIIFTITGKSRQLNSLMTRKSRKILSFEHFVSYDGTEDTHNITFKRLPPGKVNVIGTNTQQVTGSEPKLIITEGFKPRKPFISLPKKLRRNSGQ